MGEEPVELRFERGEVNSIYRETKLIVHSRDCDGKPRLMARIPDGLETEPRGDEEFVTAFIWDRDEPA